MTSPPSHRLVGGPKPVRPPRTIIVKTVDLSPTQYRFKPADITVQPGDTIRWLQTSNVPHNIEFKQVPGGTKLGSQRVGPYLVSPGQTYEDRGGRTLCEGRAPLRVHPSRSAGVGGNHHRH